VKEMTVEGKMTEKVFQLLKPVVKRR